MLLVLAPDDVGDLGHARSQPWGAQHPIEELAPSNIPAPRGWEGSEETQPAVRRSSYNGRDGENWFCCVPRRKGSSELLSRNARGAFKRLSEGSVCITPTVAGSQGCARP